MPQPIPKKIKDINPDAGVKPFYTLLVDGSNLLETCSSVAHTLNSRGEDYGGIVQFFVQLKLMLRKGNFRYVYVMWDGDESGLLRYRCYSQYKANRDKNFSEDNLSPYMKAVNEKIKSMENYFFNKRRDPAKLAELREHKEIFHRQREIIMECLEELYIRQCLCEYTEADDFIGYYVAHKKPNEKIIIMSNDRDITQLIEENVAVYEQRNKRFITDKNHVELMGYDHRNVLLKKMICGDYSDNIKGIKGVGEKTLLTNFVEFKERKVELEEVVSKAREINEERMKRGKKPLQWAYNIANRVTDGVQGDMIYEINRRIIDLHNPLMIDEAKELMDSMMYNSMDPEGRSFGNLYNIIKKYDITELEDDARFGNFFSDFVDLANKEEKNLPC